MARKSLVQTVADELLDRIVDGRYAPDAPLPSEAELGEAFDVSRVTVREALRVLTAQGIVRVASGIGSRVEPAERWTSLEAILRHASVTGDSGAVAEQLIAVRRMFETEAAALAAGRLDEADLAELEDCVERMRTASAANHIAGFVDADLRFHDLITHGAGNVFLGVLFEPLSRVLAERRRETSRVPEIQANAIVEHAAVVVALRSGSASAARAAMDHHMTQTLDDLRRYVLGRTAP